MLGPLPELKPMARARMGYRCHGWRHLGRSTKRWRSAGIGSCRRTPLGGTRGSSALHAPDGRPEGSDGRKKPEAKLNYHERVYSKHLYRYMRPAQFCHTPIASDAILRILDAGRSGGACSGYGRIETAPWQQPSRGGHMDAEEDESHQKRKHPEHVPAHIFNAIQEKASSSSSARARARQPVEGAGEQRPFEEYLKTAAVGPSSWHKATAFGGAFDSEAKAHVEHFPIVRLSELLEEKEIVWTFGQNKPRSRASRPAQGLDGQVVRDRGRFPTIDEQASLIDELTQKEILKLAYKRRSRRHPKWQEIAYEAKKGHKSFLRRRQVLLDEVKARMGVLRQALQDA